LQAVEFGPGAGRAGRRARRGVHVAFAAGRRAGRGGAGSRTAGRALAARLNVAAGAAAGVFRRLEGRVRNQGRLGGAARLLGRAEGVDAADGGVAPVEHLLQLERLGQVHLFDLHRVVPLFVVQLPELLRVVVGDRLAGDLQLERRGVPLAQPDAE